MVARDMQDLTYGDAVDQRVKLAPLLGDELTVLACARQHVDSNQVQSSPCGDGKERRG